MDENLHPTPEAYWSNGFVKNCVQHPPLVFTPQKNSLAAPDFTNMAAAMEKILKNIMLQFEKEWAFLYIELS